MAWQYKPTQSGWLPFWCFGLGVCTSAIQIAEICDTKALASLKAWWNDNWRKKDGAANKNHVSLPRVLAVLQIQRCYDEPCCIAGNFMFSKEDKVVLSHNFGHSKSKDAKQLSKEDFIRKMVGFLLSTNSFTSPKTVSTRFGRRSFQSSLMERTLTLTAPTFSCPTIHLFPTVVLLHVGEGKGSSI